MDTSTRVISGDGKSTVDVGNTDEYIGQSNPEEVRSGGFEIREERRAFPEPELKPSESTAELILPEGWNGSIKSLAVWENGKAIGRGSGYPSWLLDNNVLTVQGPFQLGKVTLSVRSVRGHGIWSDELRQVGTTFSSYWLFPQDGGGESLTFQVGGEVDAFDWKEDTVSVQVGRGLRSRPEIVSLPTRVNSTGIAVFLALSDASTDLVVQVLLPGGTSAWYGDLGRSRLHLSYAEGLVGEKGFLVARRSRAAFRNLPRDLSGNIQFGLHDDGRSMRLFTGWGAKRVSDLLLPSRKFNAQYDRIVVRFWRGRARIGKILALRLEALEQFNGRAVPELLAKMKADLDE